MAAASNFLEDEILDHTLGKGARDWAPPANLYVALATATFADDNSGSGELSGGGYARQSVAFGVSSGGSATNTGALTFTNLSGVSATAISHFGIFDAVTGGNLLIHGALTVAKTVPDGDDAVIQTSQLAVTVA